MAGVEQGFCVLVLDLRILVSQLMIDYCMLQRNVNKLKWEWIKNSIQKD